MLSAFFLVSCLAGPADGRISVLFLGDNGHHRPKDRFQQLKPVFAARGIDLTYTDRMTDLQAAVLYPYAGLLIYANTESISPQQEKALLDFVAAGKGLIPVHCASYCFLNSPAYISLVGAQFKSHGTGIFRTTAVETGHPIMKGYQPFESWDETYVHHRHNRDRQVLETRVNGKETEPWTWVRTHEKGRVFYTAWGHDQRTWANPGFQNLLERGVRWAVGSDPQAAPVYRDRPAMRPIAAAKSPFTFEPAVLPFYPASERWGLMGEPIAKMQRPLAPADSILRLSTPVEFEPKLFTAEPLIGKPIAIAWDERGRLYVAETVDYPNEKQPAGGGRDRIRICEDTNNDGVADKFTVFADKLSIPTSMAFANGGLVVHQAPDTLFLKDTNGDDVADERRILFTGWAVNDTHAGPSNLVSGPDHWMYGMVGYAGFRGTVGGERQRFATGFYRFKPDGSKIEFLRNTSNNSWGVGFSEDGHLFGSTANGCPSVHLAIPNRYYERVRGWSSSVLPSIASSNKVDPIRKEVRQVDHHGGFTAGAGHALYTARNYPDYYWNRTAFVCEPTASLAATFQIFPAGAGFRSHNSWNLAVSDDEWTAPIIAEVGPDGNVWIVDWYNIIVQHNPTPIGYKTGKGNAYEIPLRDKKHGRVYRITVAGAKPAEAPFTLHKASSQKLIDTLRHPNLFWRRHAQRLLVEAGDKGVVPALLQLLKEPKVDAIGLDVGAMHALWTLNGLGAFSEEKTVVEAVSSAFKHPSPGVRRTLVLALPPTSNTAGKTATSLLNDVDPHVRLAALLAVADAPPSDAAAVRIADQLTQEPSPLDPLLRDGAIAAASVNAVPFLTALLKQGATVKWDETVVSIVAEHAARNASSQVGRLIEAMSTSASPAKSAAIAAALAKGWPRDRPAKLSDAEESALVALIDRLPARQQSTALTLANKLGSKKLATHAQRISQALTATVASTDAKNSERIAAAGQLMQLLKGDEKSARGIVAALDARTSPELASGLLSALGQSEAPGAGAILVAELPNYTPAVRERAILTLTSRPMWTKALLKGVETGKASWNDFTLDQKQALAVHPDAEIAAVAKRLLSNGGALPNADRQKVIEQFAHLATAKGDSTLGKAVYKKHCAVCHRHSGEGGNVGPDLTGMAVHPRTELLVHLLDPSRSVEGNFRAFTIATADGRVVTGLMSSETKTSVELIDAQAKKVVVLREDIEKLVASNKSLMPEGFEKQCTSDELAALLAYLTQRGKYIPLDLAKAATVSTYKGMFYSEEELNERMLFSDWSPKTFGGVPFTLVDPQEGRMRNAVMLNGPMGKVPPRMPKAVKTPCNMPVRSLHLLSGVSGWGFPYSRRGSVSMIVRFHYTDGKTEDHPLTNGKHFADYIGRRDVPDSQFAFDLAGKQLRYLSIAPKLKTAIKDIEFLKGTDQTAPIVMAATIETGE